MLKKRKTALNFFLAVILASVLLSGCSEDSSEIPLQFRTDTAFKLARINIKDYGSIVFRLYTDEEPELCAKFAEICRSGYFDGKSFFYMVEDYLLMGGEAPEDENGNKREEQNVTARASKNLHPYRGSLCASYTNGKNVDLSSFYIIGMDTERLADIEELIEIKGYTFSDYIKFGYKTELTRDELETYREYGGAPWLDGHTAVFGQAYDGLDVLDAVIAAHSEDESVQIIIDGIETN
ncbi:MAG: peptidylprolyl isomerase [Lachnospiraceae bacterium]|nr:peptidylprolyl isomerase [Lachnospiraceae bacterium]